MKHLVTVALLASTACATAYQTSNHFTGGFDEIALAPNVYKVSFKGNGYTSSDRAEALALLRSADLTLQKGFKYFALADSENSTSLSAYTTPVTANTTASVTAVGNTAYGTATTTYSGGQTEFISKPRAANVVVMFLERPQIHGMVFDAQFICESLGPKYKATCGAK
jgi:hypothetical protein